MDWEEVDLVELGCMHGVQEGVGFHASFAYRANFHVHLAKAIARTIIFISLYRLLALHSRFATQYSQLMPRVVSEVMVPRLGFLSFSPQSHLHLDSYLALPPLILISLPTPSACQELITMSGPSDNKPHAFNPPNVPAPPPSYSQLCITPLLPSSRLITLAGMTGCNPSSTSNPKTLPAQAPIAYKNILNALAAAGATPRSEAFILSHYTCLRSSTTYLILQDNIS